MIYKLLITENWYVKVRYNLINSENLFFLKRCHPCLHSQAAFDN